MRRRALRVWYWDACIFLAWLHDDWAGVPGVMEGIEEMAKDINDGKAALMTSVVTKTEVLQHKLKPKALDTFTNFFKRQNVTWVQHDERVGDRSHEIRDYYAQPPRNIVLDTDDCIHLATAILYQAETFYTLDGAGKRKRKTDLLPLNGVIAGK